MIHFFQTCERHVYAVQSACPLPEADVEKLTWLFSGAQLLPETSLQGTFIGPRRENDYPVEHERRRDNPEHGHRRYHAHRGVRTGHRRRCLRPHAATPLRRAGARPLHHRQAARPHPAHRRHCRLQRAGRPRPEPGGNRLPQRREPKAGAQADGQRSVRLLASELRALPPQDIRGQVRHRRRGEARIALRPHQEDLGHEPQQARVGLQGQRGVQRRPRHRAVCPRRGDTSDFFRTKPIESVISLKAETHNFPTTVEPFNGAATGTGGEIRDRLGGGKASLPIAGTAVYMTSYPRPALSLPSPSQGGDVREWEQHTTPRPWLYQTPEQILIKASNGASDFGNKFGQPLICGSLLTFEHEENGKTYGYDKVIMLAGGVGFAKKADALKGTPEPHEKVVVMGGDNYRIGMGGGAVSSVDTGQYANAIELNAVQRANPEMQKRVANVIRTLAESDDNPIVSIHDHGAGGHLNCLSELVETTGGRIDMSQLPIGDPTLSAKEIIGNESQERMGFLLREQDVERVRRLAERERAPMYVVGETTGDMQFVFAQKGWGGSH